jgi:hypothetical protein
MTYSHIDNLIKEEHKRERKKLFQTLRKSKLENPVFIKQDLTYYDIIKDDIITYHIYRTFIDLDNIKQKPTIQDYIDILVDKYSLYKGIAEKFALDYMTRGYFIKKEYCIPVDN